MPSNQFIIFLLFASISLGCSPQFNTIEQDALFQGLAQDKRHHDFSASATTHNAILLADEGGNQPKNQSFT